MKKDLPRFFSALGDKTRLKIFDILRRKRDICVSELAKKLGISVSAVSQQLRILELSGLVARIRNGQMICYEVKKVDPIVKSIIKILS